MQETPAPEKEKRTLITGDAQAKKQFYIALAFMIVALIGTLWLYGYTWYQNQTIQTLKDEITTTDANIVEIEWKRDVALALLLKQIGWVEESPNLIDIVDKFRNLAVQSSVQFQGFTLEKNMIKTSVISTISGNGTNRDTVQYILNMADEFVRNQNAEAEKNFVMQPILTITGTPEQRITSIELEFRNASGVTVSNETTTSSGTTE